MQFSFLHNNWVLLWWNAHLISLCRTTSLKEEKMSMASKFYQHAPRKFCQVFWTVKIFFICISFCIYSTLCYALNVVLQIMRFLSHLASMREVISFQRLHLWVLHLEIYVVNFSCYSCCISFSGTRKKGIQLWIYSWHKIHICSDGS